jgi:hypothetical protein
MKISLALLLVAFLSISCFDSSETASNKQVFDFKLLFQKQVELLTAKERKVLKRSSFNFSGLGTPSVLSVNWDKELELFLQLDLNKPALRMSYDSILVGYTKVYKLKSTENLPIKYVAINSFNGKANILAKVKVSNMLYDSEKNLNATIESGELSFYKITGFQKIVFFPKSFYAISAKVKK